MPSHLVIPGLTRNLACRPARPVMLMGQGYHGTGLQEILDAVNIPKGSFYNYFGSKEDFGAEVIQHYIDPFIAQLTTH